MRRRLTGTLLAVAGSAVLVAACSSGAATTSPSASPRAPAQVTSAAPLAYRYMTDSSDYATTGRYGFNLVDLGPYPAQIDVLPAGQRALVWLGGYSRATCTFSRSDADVRQLVSSLATDPKVAGYYIADEPDDGLPAYGGHCPHVLAQVTARNKLVRDLAPGVFTYETIAEPGNFAAFAKATDVMGADPYPCLRGLPCNWSLIPTYIAKLSAAHVARYWGVLQAFAYAKWRAPTPAELARMISQWQQSRWQGEQTFAWSYQGWSLADQPGLLSTLRNLNLGPP